MKFINEISDKFLSAPINSSRWLFSFNTIQQNSKIGIKNFLKTEKMNYIQGQTFVVDDNQSLMELEKTIDRIKSQWFSFSNI
jgi:hypothetical protein